MTSIRSIVVRTALVLLGLCVPLLLFETELRVEHYIRKGTSPWKNPSSRWDAVLGWTGREHSLGAADAPVSILVVGDSFTEGLGVPSERMWFAPLAREVSGRRLVAYGGLGYGTLQEQLVLDSYMARGIQPDLVVLQLCSNDIINNHFELEKASYLQRPPAPRPYLEGGVVVTRFPRDYGDLLLPLLSLSRFAYHYSNKWDIHISELAKTRAIESIEYRIGREGFEYALFNKAVRVTDRLLERFRRSTRGAPMVGMLIDDIEPYTAALKGIAKKRGFPLLVPVKVRPVPKEERHADGAHLNDAGNTALGETFVTMMRERGLLPTSSQQKPSA